MSSNDKDRVVAAMNGAHCPHCNSLHRHDLGCPNRREPVGRMDPRWKVGERKALSMFERAQGAHEGCNYLAFDFCNKCGQVPPVVPAREATPQPRPAISGADLARAAEVAAEARREANAKGADAVEVSSMSLPYVIPTMDLALSLPDGLAWCGDCAASVGMCKHRAGDGPLMILVKRSTAAEARAEFAESLLGAMAFEHGLDRMGHFDLSEEEIASAAQRGGWVWAPCEKGECVFCDAAREGGR